MRSRGTVGAQWLHDLQRHVEELTTMWNLKLGAELTGGIGSYVRRVHLSDGEPAVLKVAVPGQELGRQADALAAAGGVGYVLLLAYDDERGALLMEPLADRLHYRTTETASALDIIGTTLTEAWRLPLYLHPHAPEADEHKAATLAALITELAPGAGPAHFDAVDQALRYLGERLAARDRSRQVVVHGDPHPENLMTLSRPRPGTSTGYVFIDPETFRCEPEYDVGVALRDWNQPLLANNYPHKLLRTWCERIAELTHTDPHGVWQWAFAERVSSGLYLSHHGLPERGETYLDVAARLIT